MLPTYIEGPKVFQQAQSIPAEQTDGPWRLNSDMANITRDCQKPNYSLPLR